MRSKPTVYAAKRNGNHNNENLFNLFAGQCALDHWHLHAGSCAAEQFGGSDTREGKGQGCEIGIGEKAKATVIPKDGTKNKGYIGQAGSDDFVLRDRKTDSPMTIRYSDVSKVESNRGHSTARNLGLGIGIGAGAFLAILLISIAHLD